MRSRPLRASLPFRRPHGPSFRHEQVIEALERAQLRDGIPQFKAGDTVRVHFQVIEGQRRRVQVFEGIVIKRQGAGVRETFTVRKQSFGVGVERTFPLHSPKIEKIEVSAIGDVNRAKLYYLRGHVGKKARVRESSRRGQRRVAAQVTRRRSPRARARGWPRSRGRAVEPRPRRRRRRARARRRSVRSRQVPAAAEPGYVGACRRAPARGFFGSTAGSAHGSSRARTRPGAARSQGRSSSPASCSTTSCLRDHRVRPLALLNDSKQLTPERARGALRAVVGARERVAVRVFSAREIDRNGLHRSNLARPARGLAALTPPAEVCLVDGFRSAPTRAAAHARSSTATRRAPRSRPPRSSRRSTRDRLMRRMDALYPALRLLVARRLHHAATTRRSFAHAGRREIHRRSFQALCYGDRAATGVGAAS